MKAPAEDTLAFGPKDRVLFVSDIHLSESAVAERDLFLAFLASLRDDPPKALFLHGDVFEFYVGPRQGRHPFHRPLFAQLRALTEAGISVYVQRGNRDYLLGRCFERVGVRVLTDRARLSLGELQVQVSHGDELCIEDESYQFWARGVLRSWPLRLLVKSLPLAIAFWLALRYRRISAAKWRGREPMSRLSTIVQGAKKRAQEAGLDALICGHIHDLADTPLEVDGHAFRLLTTGSWQEAPNAVEWSDGRFALRRFPELSA